METKDELKEMLVNNAASWGKKEGDDMAEIYVDDFLNELLSKFKLLPIPVVSDSEQLVCDNCKYTAIYEGYEISYLECMKCGKTKAY